MPRSRGSPPQQLRVGQRVNGIHPGTGSQVVGTVSYIDDGSGKTAISLDDGTTVTVNSSANSVVALAGVAEGEAWGGGARGAGHTSSAEVQDMQRAHAPHPRGPCESQLEALEKPRAHTPQQAISPTAHDEMRGQSAVWEWRRGSGGGGSDWAAYEPAVSAVIEEFYQAKHSHCPLGDREIEFETMRQFVVADRRRSRAVRRRIGHPPMVHQTPPMANVQMWNQTGDVVDVRLETGEWSVKLNPAATKGSWYGCDFPSNNTLVFHLRGKLFGRWKITSHKKQHLFCEISPQTELITVGAVACHESDPNFDRYTFNLIRETAEAIRATGQVVTIHEVAARGGLQEYAVKEGQQAADRQMRRRTGSPQRDGRSPQRERRSPERRGAGGARVGHRQSGGVFTSEVQPPVGTVAVAILEHLQVADPQDESTNWHTLSKIYHRGRCTRLGGDLRSLIEAVQRYERANSPRFWSDLLPFACLQALRFQELFPLLYQTRLRFCMTQLFASEQDKISVVDVSSEQRGVPRIVEWDQAQCLCILCNAMLCQWQNRTSDRSGCLEHPGRSGLPSINFDFMMCGPGSHQAQVAKCEMFLHYLAKQKQRIESGDPFNRKISFVRHKVVPNTGVSLVDAQAAAVGGGDAGGARAASVNGVRVEPDWVSSSNLLKPIAVKSLGESIDEAKDMLRADFANATIGGGSISHGSVQEEIMFACHPELNCARLVFTPMQDDEAFILIGAEQFALPQGYGGGLTCGGLYDDHTGLQPDRCQLASYITAIDALDYRYFDPSGVIQFHADHIKRELLKAYAGFALSPESVGNSALPATLATGNWGAGCFLGDAQLKALIQWAAASEAGLSMCYFPWEDDYIAAQLQPVTEEAVARGTTVGQLCEWLFTLKSHNRHCSRPGFDTLKAFGEWVAANA